MTTSLLTLIESVFAELGVVASKRCDIRASCFDYVARKGSKPFLLKVAPSLDELPREDATELTLIAERLQAAPLIISELKNRHPLEDDIVYERCGAFAMTLRTFVNMMKSGDLPLVKSEPGGLFVLLDEELLRRRREELNLSRGELASRAGISKKALYAYERGLAKATLSVALRLQRILGAPLTRGFDLFRKLEHLYGFPRRGSDDKVLGEVCKKLVELKFSVMLTRKSPFDLLTQSREGETLLMVIARELEEDYRRRIEVVRSISQVAILPMLVVSEGLIDDRSAITLDDFRKADRGLLLNLARIGSA